MCGRYFFKLEDTIIFDELRKKIEQFSMFEYATDEIYPSNRVVVLVDGKEDYDVDIMTWGLKNFDNKMLINARSEHIERKKTFRPMLQNRCLIPCNGFFEWKSIGQRKKQKLFIQKKNTSLFYLAGLYDEQKRFVIVTGDAQGDMKNIHNRVPIIIDENQMQSYLHGDIDFPLQDEDFKFQKEPSNSYQQQLGLFDEENK